MRSRRHTYVLIALLAPTFVAALAGALWSVDQALPYRPYHFYGFRDIPQAICGGRSMTVSIDQKIEDGYGVEAAEIEYAWADAARRPDGPTVLEFSSAQTIINLQPSPRGVVSRPEIASPPQQAGTYRLYARITIYGQRFLFPDRQELTVASDQEVRVLGESNPRCQKGEPS